MQCIELSSAELDLVILGGLQSHVNFSYSKKRHRMSDFSAVLKYVRKHFSLCMA